MGSSKNSYYYDYGVIKLPCNENISSVDLVALGIKQLL
jgi:hypothetical protein